MFAPFFTPSVSSHAPAVVVESVPASQRGVAHAADGILVLDLETQRNGYFFSSAVDPCASYLTAPVRDTSLMCQEWIQLHLRERGDGVDDAALPTLRSWSSSATTTIATAATAATATTGHDDTTVRSRSTSTTVGVSRADAVPSQSLHMIAFDIWSLGSIDSVALSQHMAKAFEHTLSDYLFHRRLLNPVSLLWSLF